MPDLVSTDIAPGQDTHTTPVLLNGERLFSFAAVAKKFPGSRGSTHLNPSTVYRWATKGVRLPNGQIARLEAAKLGTIWRTSLEAVSRFCEQVTAAAMQNEPTQESPRQHTPAAQKRDATRASAELAELLG